MEVFKVGLFLPITHDKTQFRKIDPYESINLLIFPENYVFWSENLVAEIKNYAKNINSAVLVGISRKKDRVKTSKNKVWYTELAFFYDPLTDQEYIYKKHTLSLEVAFEDSGWCPDRNLQVVKIGSFKIGITLCYDMFISLLMRYLSVVNGANILVNPSATAVKPIKWASILVTRALENKTYTLCTMHKNPPFNMNRKSKNKANVYGFDPKGKCLLFRNKISNRLPWYQTNPSDKPGDGLYITEIPPKLNPLPLTISKCIPVAKKFDAKWKLTHQTLEICWNGKYYGIVDFSPDNVEVIQNKIAVLMTENESIFHPEDIYSVLLDNVNKILGKKLIIWNHWEKTFPEFLSLELLKALVIARALEFVATVIISGSEAKTLVGMILSKVKAVSIKEYENEGKMRLEFSSGLNINGGMLRKILY